MSDITIHNLIQSGQIEPSTSAPSTAALEWAIAALEGYEYADDCCDLDGNADDRAHAQALADVIAYLERTITTRQRRSDVAAAKRAYAAEHGIPISSVRVVR